MDIDDFFPRKNIDVDRIIQFVRQDLNKLYETHISSLKPGVFYIVGHKSYHLYSELNERLTHAGFLVGFLYPFIEGGYILKGYIPTRPSFNVYLAVDSINTGKEMENVLQSLYYRKIKVRKIFSYISNISGIRRLEEKRLIPSESIVSVHTFQDPASYENFYNERLQIYYQSMIEPMDIDHPYRIYTVRGIEVDELIKIISECIYKSIGKNEVDFDRIESYVPTIRAFSFDFLNMNGEIPDSIQNIFAPIEINLESISVRIRAVHNKDINFSIIVCCQPDVKMKTLFKNGKRFCTGRVKHCYIRAARFFGKKRKPLRDNVLCPLCLSNELSVILLDSIHKQMFKMQEKKNFKIQLDKIYLPFQ